MNKKIDVDKLIKQSYFGTVRLTIGCMNRVSQVTYFNGTEKCDIRGSIEDIVNHINSLPKTSEKNEKTLKKH